MPDELKIKVTSEADTSGLDSTTQACILTGPWWYLDNQTYRQEWTFQNASAATPNP